MRHKWDSKHRTYGSRRATCLRCGIIKDERFNRDFHWTEWLRPGAESRWFRSDTAPPCEPDSTLTKVRRASSE